MRSFYLVLILLSLPLCTLNSSAETIKIVSSLPRTGSSNAQTSSIVNGIKLALSEVGNKIGDYSLSFEDWDDASPERGNWDPSTEAINADKAVKDPDVMIYMGPFNSGASKISMPKLNQAGMLQINPGSTWPGLTKPGIGEPNEPKVYRPSGKITFYRVLPADDIQGSVAAKWSAELGVKKAFIVHDGELYGKGIASVFKKNAAANGFQIAGMEQTDAKASNYRSLAVKIKQSGADLVYFGGTTQSNVGQLIKDLRSSGYTAKIMVPDGCFENAFIDSAGKENLENSTYITFGGIPGEQLVGRGKEFYETYKRTYQSEPEAYASYGYEAGRVAVEVIRRAGKKDRRAILDAAATIKNFEGLLGTWSFDENGDTTLRVMSGNIVKDGKFEFAKLLN